MLRCQTCVSLSTLSWRACKPHSVQYMLQYSYVCATPIVILSSCCLWARYACQMCSLCKNMTFSSQQAAVSTIAEERMLQLLHSSCALVAAPLWWSCSILQLCFENMHIPGIPGKACCSDCAAALGPLENHSVTEADLE